MVKGGTLPGFVYVGWSDTVRGLGSWSGKDPRMNMNTGTGSEIEPAERAGLVLPPDAILAGVAVGLVDQARADGIAINWHTGRSHREPDLGDC